MQRPQRQQTTCSRCGNIGHNRRNQTCPLFQDNQDFVQPSRRQQYNGYLMRQDLYRARMQIFQEYFENQRRQEFERRIQEYFENESDVGDNDDDNNRRQEQIERMNVQEPIKLGADYMEELNIIVARPYQPEITNTYECPVCYENKTYDEVIFMVDCSHHICGECFNGYSASIKTTTRKPACVCCRTEIKTIAVADNVNV
jgi:Zinc knuckle